MADEVTKKDLQSLQGYCNKQIADVEKRMLKEIFSQQKIAAEEVNVLVRTFNTNDAELLRGHTDQDKKVATLYKTVNELVNRVNQLQKQVQD